MQFSDESVGAIYYLETLVITCRRMPFNGVPAALNKHMTQLDSATGKNGVVTL
jgi:hypothetical protein